MLDLNLHNSDGAEAIERIKADRPSTAIVVSTVSVDRETKRRVLDAGADAYLTKPYDRDELLAALDEHLG